MGFGVALLILSLMCDLILFIQIAHHQVYFLLHTANENCDGCRGNLISASSALGTHCALHSEANRRSQNENYFSSFGLHPNPGGPIGSKGCQTGSDGSPGSLLGENGYKEWSHVALVRYIDTKDLSIGTKKGQIYVIYHL